MQLQDMAYPGSRYPTVPWATLDIWVWSSSVCLDSPKSDTFALMLISRRILLVFTSRWMILGLHPECKYSRPEENSSLSCSISQIITATWAENTRYQPLAASSAIRRRASQSNCFWLEESVSELTYVIYFYFWLTDFWQVEAPYHACDLAKFHCACIRKLAYFDFLLHNIQLKEPNFCGGFLTREQSASKL